MFPNSPYGGGFGLSNDPSSRTSPSQLKPPTKPATNKTKQRTPVIQARGSPQAQINTNRTTDRWQKSCSFIITILSQSVKSNYLYISLLHRRVALRGIPETDGIGQWILKRLTVVKLKLVFSWKLRKCCFCLLLNYLIPPLFVSMLRTNRIKLKGCGVNW